MKNFTKHSKTSGSSNWSYEKMWGKGKQEAEVEGGGGCRGGRPVSQLENKIKANPVLGGEQIPQVH